MKSYNSHSHSLRATYLDISENWLKDTADIYCFTTSGCHHRIDVFEGLFKILIQKTADQLIQILKDFPKFFSEEV